MDISNLKIDKQLWDRTYFFLLSLYLTSILLENFSLFGVSLAFVCASIFSGAILVNWVVTKPKLAPPHSYLVFFGIVILTMGVSNWGAVFGRETFLPGDIVLCFLFSIVIYLALLESLQTMTNAFLFSSIIIGILTIAVFFGFGVNYGSDGRLGFFNAGLNEFALKVVFGFVVLAGWAFEKWEDKSGLALLFVLLLPFQLWTIIFSGSRTAWCACILGLILLFFSHCKIYGNGLQKTKLWFVAILIVVSELFLLFQLQSRFFDLNIFSLKSRLAFVGNDSSLTELGGRLDIWSYFLTSGMESPVLGVGYSSYVQSSVLRFGDLESPHNVFLEVFLLSGCLGLTLYTLAFFKLFNQARIMLHQNNWMPIVLLSTVFLGFSIGYQSLSEKLCWLIVVYACVAAMQSTCPQTKGKKN